MPAHSSHAVNPEKRTCFVGRTFAVADLNCHISLVPVPERLRRVFAAHLAADEARDIRPPLDRDLRNARKQLRRPAPEAEQASGVGRSRCRVADGKHIRVARNRQVRIHFDAP